MLQSVDLEMMWGKYSQHTRVRPSLLVGVGLR